MEFYKTLLGKLNETNVGITVLVGQWEAMEQKFRFHEWELHIKLLKEPMFGICSLFPKY